MKEEIIIIIEQAIERYDALNGTSFLCSDYADSMEEENKYIKKQKYAVKKLAENLLQLIKSNLKFPLVIKDVKDK